MRPPARDTRAGMSRPGSGLSRYGARVALPWPTILDTSTRIQKHLAGLNASYRQEVTVTRVALSLLLLVAFAADAAAATSHYFAPQAIAQSGDGVEAYVPVPFETPGRLSGEGLADAALTELRGAVDETGAITVVVNGRKAAASVDAARAADPAVMDRALGAVFYTLTSTGITEVTLDGHALSPEVFTRGAFVAVMPLAAALPPGRLDRGFVRVGAELVPVASFYERLAGGDKAVQQAARELLTVGGTAVKLHLFDNLASLRLKDQETVVIGRLDDPAPEVRLAALKLLAGKATTPVMKALEQVAEKDAVAEVKLAAVRMLVALGKREFEKYLLLDKLTSSDAAVVVDALKGLVKTGDAAFAPAMAALVKHSNDVVRDAAVDAVKAMKQYALMVAWLGDAQVGRGVRERAARILSDEAVGPQRAQGISWLVVEGDSANAVHAAELAGKDRVAGTTAALGKALKRSEAEVRDAAARALGALKDTAGLEPLAAAVRDAGDAGEKELLTEQATLIIGVQPLDQVIQISRSTDVTVRELAIKSLAAFSQDKPNKKANAVLEEALSSKEAPIRQAAAYALARIPDEDLAAKLAKLKDDTDPIVRAQVAYALARSKQPQVDEILLGYLDDREADVKVAAIEGLRVRKVGAALDKVKWLVGHRKLEVKREALKAMLALATPADPTLFDIYTKALLESDEELRLMAVAGLGAYKDDPRATRAIGGAVTDERASLKLKVTALKTLAGMTEPDTVEHVVRGLFDADREVKLATLDALEKLGNGKATRPLQEFILGESDKDVQTRAEAVLEKL